VSQFFSQEIWKYFITEFESGTFLGTDGCCLNYTASKSKEGNLCLIVLGGRTEFSQKYAELFYDLRGLGLSCYSFDHRGQGLSQRLLDDPRKGHVEKFSYYSKDLKIFIDEIVRVNSHDTLIILGHSMGGTIALDFQLRYPGVVDGIVFSSPMLGINTAPLNRFFAGILVRAAVLLGFKEKIIVGSGYYDSCKEFIGNKVTSDRHRFQSTRDLFEKYHEAQLGGPTYNWVDEAFAAMKNIIARAEEITIPIMLLQSAADEVVDNLSQNIFCSACPGCELQRIEHSKHEILMEADLYRKEALAAVRSFLQSFQAENK